MQYHLGAPVDRRDRAQLRHYLRRAVVLGRQISDREGADLSASGAFDQAELAEILAGSAAPENRRAMLPYLDLDVRIDGYVAGNDGALLQYLQEVSVLPDAPGRVFTRMAGEVSIAEGRWAAEDKILGLLEEAVRRDDPDGMIQLARRLVRYRDDPAQVTRVENLLLTAIDRHGAAPRPWTVWIRCIVASCPMHRGWPRRPIGPMPIAPHPMNGKRFRPMT